jgi:hypothetical protein
MIFSRHDWRMLTELAGAVGISDPLTKLCRVPVEECSERPNNAPPIAASQERHNDQPSHFDIISKNYLDMADCCFLFLA